MLQVLYELMDDTWMTFPFVRILPWHVIEQLNRFRVRVPRVVVLSPYKVLYMYVWFTRRWA